MSENLPVVDLVGVNFEHVSRPGGTVEIKYNRGWITAEKVSLLMNLPSTGWEPSAVRAKELTVAGLKLTVDFITGMSINEPKLHRFQIEGQGEDQLVLGRRDEDLWLMEYGAYNPIRNGLTIEEDGVLRLFHMEGDLPPVTAGDYRTANYHIQGPITRSAFGYGATYYES
ncbi:hypothetical protein MK805_04235 [Shimazuella sp. AN120528]|uniref:hypothetical protein n=1 Tax=Shimazuella soli TaxID=1892854 RepID=UPI001F0D44FC|nr:hypothetical protein [Shimazuella soli]MCH5584175.1 hypothetical protein [Shimazuella soli]